MKELIEKHFKLSLEIAKINREKTDIQYQIVGELAEKREYRYFSVNWTRLYREQIQRNIRELHI